MLVEDIAACTKLLTKDCPFALFMERVGRALIALAGHDMTAEEFLALTDDGIGRLVSLAREKLNGTDLENFEVLLDSQVHLEKSLCHYRINVMEANGL